MTRDPKKISIFFLGLFLSLLLLSGCGPALPAAGQLSREDLELKQLALEVSQLQQEQQYYVFNRLIGILGGVLGAVAILWTIAQGYQTLHNQAVSQKQSRVAEILTALSSDIEMNRLGAARSLSRYPNETLDEILSALRFEDSPAVREVLEDTLEKINRRNIPRLLAANAKTLEERATLLGRLSRAGVDPAIAKAFLRLSDHAAGTLRKNRDFRFRYDHGSEYQAYERHIQEQLGQSESQENAALGQVCKRSVNLARSSSKVIARLLRLGYKPGRVALHLDLTASNLYRANLPAADLPNSIFTWSVMRHIDLRRARLAGSDLSNCNMYGAKLEGADLSKCSLVDTTLVDIEAENASFVESDIARASFSRGQLRNADFSRCKGWEPNFKGTHAKNVRFDESELGSAHFEGTTLVHSSLREARFFRASWKDTHILDSNLERIMLNGADLSGAKFQGSDFKDADLSGADLKKADFRGAQNLATAKFKGVKNLDAALFDPGVNLPDLK